MYEMIRIHVLITCTIMSKYGGSHNLEIKNINRMKELMLIYVSLKANCHV